VCGCEVGLGLDTGVTLIGLVSIEDKIFYFTAEPRSMTVNTALRSEADSPNITNSRYFLGSIISSCQTRGLASLPARFVRWPRNPPADSALVQENWPRSPLLNARFAGEERSPSALRYTRR